MSGLLQGAATGKSIAGFVFLAFLLWLLFWGYDWLRGWVYVGAHRMTDLEVWMAKGSEGGSHESGSSSDGKGKGGYTGRHEAAVKPAPVPVKGGGGKK